ncbi:hypothetical protein LZ198_06710 [Myxococcus sp. K15C18031901]|nr:hypothetical protein [Myxococcus dinghuensis]
MSEVSGVEELSDSAISSIEEGDQTLPPMSMGGAEADADPVVSDAPVASSSHVGTGSRIEEDDQTLPPMSMGASDVDADLVVPSASPRVGTGSRVEEDDQTLPPMSLEAADADEDLGVSGASSRMGTRSRVEEDDQTLPPMLLDEADADENSLVPDAPVAASSRAGAGASSGAGPDADSEKTFDLLENVPSAASLPSAAPKVSPTRMFGAATVPPAFPPGVDVGQGPSGSRPSAAPPGPPRGLSPPDFGDEPTHIKVPPLTAQATGRAAPPTTRPEGLTAGGTPPAPALRASDFDDVPAPSVARVGPPVSEGDEGPTLAHVPPTVGAPIASEVPDYAITPQVAPAFIAAPARAKAPRMLALPAPDDAPTPAHQVVPRLATSSALVAAKAPAAPTAAELARRRRELASTRWGQLLLGWRALPLARRLLAITVSLFVLGVASGALILAFRKVVASGAGALEPMALGVEPVVDSFGVGEGVKWVHADEKSFDFQFVAPTRAVALLHYQASGIASEEVSMVLNGANIGWIPPDTLSTAERELEVILPARLLKRGVMNHFVFDNVHNPPGQDAWRVWNLRLEVFPVPELPPEELLSKAREYVSTAGRYYETRGVGAESLFRAWQQYRFAWITLEALDPKPDLYQDVRYRLAQVSAELDHQCAQLMLEFQRGVQFRSARQARAALQEVSRRFPTTEHRCHNLAQEKAFEHEL